VDILFIADLLRIEKRHVRLSIVKNFAKQVLFFLASFVGVLLVSAFVALLQEWTSLAVLFPPALTGENSGPALNFLESLENSLPVAFYASILLGLSYASRRRLSYPVVFIILLVFSLVLGSAVFTGLENLAGLGEFTVNAKKVPENLAQPGLILNMGYPFNEVQTVFLEDPLKNNGARAVSREGQAMYYQRHGALLIQAPLPFVQEKSSLFASIDRDFAQSAQVFSARYKSGFASYWIYSGSLAVFLLSLGCLINISFWHLANLFFAALVFRGALALEAFLSQPNINGLLVSFAGNIIPGSLINPVIFCTLAALILLYSGLLYLARGRVSSG